MHTCCTRAALLIALLAAGRQAFGQASPTALQVTGNAAWMDSVQRLPLAQQVAAVRARLLADTVYRGFQPALCRGLIGTVNGHPAPAVVRPAALLSDTRPLGVTLFYVVDNYPMTGNTATAVADFWRHAAGPRIRQVTLLRDAAAAAIYGARATNGAVILSSKKP